MVYLYVIRSLKDNGYYIGISKDVDGRLNKHNSGLVRSTKHRRPFELVMFEKYSSYEAAREREKEVKSFKGGYKFKELINNCGIV